MIFHENRLPADDSHEISYLFVIQQKYHILFEISYLIIFVIQQTILVKYHTLFVIFEKAAKF